MSRDSEVREALRDAGAYIASLGGDESDIVAAKIDRILDAHSSEASLVNAVGPTDIWREARRTVASVPNRADTPDGEMAVSEYRDAVLRALARLDAHSSEAAPTPDTAIALTADEIDFIDDMTEHYVDGSGAYTDRETVARLVLLVRRLAARAASEAVLDAHSSAQVSFGETPRHDSASRATDTSPARNGPTSGASLTVRHQLAHSSEAAPVVGLSDVAGDDFRDEHERAMRDHLLGMQDGHVCDDLCSDAIVTFLAARLTQTRTLGETDGSPSTEQPRP